MVSRTPGPWTITGGYPDQVLIGDYIWHAHCSPGDPQAVADAHLIVAAPRLYDTLKEIEDLLENTLTYNRGLSPLEHRLLELAKDARDQVDSRLPEVSA